MAALAPLEAVLQTYDQEVAAHAERVSALAHAMAERLSWPDDARETTRLGARLLDIGLVGVSSDILHRPGALTIGEYNAVKNHCRNGYNILRAAGSDDSLATTVLHHHERVDGSGYPLGLKGNSMSPGGRLVAVADTAAALTFARPYREAFGVEAAMQHIREHAGRHFDPEMAGVCITLFQSGWAFPAIETGAARPDFKAKRPALRVAALFDDNPFAVVITDADMRVLDVNHAFRRITGMQRDGVVGQTAAIWLSPHDRGDSLSGILSSATDRGRWRGQVWCRRQEGPEFPAYLDLVAVRDDHGEATDLVGFFNDLSAENPVGDTVTEMINELSRKNAELAAALDHAKAASTAKTQFLASMSHELRTPLTAVLGFSDAILTGAFGPTANPKHSEYVEHIRESGLHLLDLITDILDVSKIEAGMMELDEDKVHVGDTVKSALRLIRSRAASRRIRILLELAENLPHLKGDERRIKEILLNLMSNAVKFSGSGKSVTLRARLDDDGAMVFAIHDEGIGMAAEDIPKALTPFGQIRNTMIRQSDGTGLGLPLTKGLIELHGGSLTMESEKGIGTTATVRFPPERVVTD